MDCRDFNFPSHETPWTHTTTNAADSARRVARPLAQYGESHRNPANELIHFIAILLSLLSLLGVVSALHPYLPYFFIAASMVYYLELSLVFLQAWCCGQRCC